MQNLLLISGSLRDDSVNTKLLKAFADSVDESVSVQWADIDLPLYNEDTEAAGFPESVERLREQILNADVIILATPEYNRAMSAALKNAIDWASRPDGDNAWQGKTVLVTSASPGSIGGALAQYQVVQTLHHVGATVPAGLEFMVSHAFDKFDEYGVLTDEQTRKYIYRALEQLGVATA